MRKAAVLFLALVLIAITINTDIDITGMFLKAASAFETIVRAVVKEVFQAIANAL